MHPGLHPELKHRLLHRSLRQHHPRSGCSEQRNLRRSLSQGSVEVMSILLVVESCLQINFPFECSDSDTCVRPSTVCSK